MKTLKEKKMGLGYSAYTRISGKTLEERLWDILEKYENEDYDGEIVDVIPYWMYASVVNDILKLIKTHSKMPIVDQKKSSNIKIC